MPPLLARCIDVVLVARLGYQAEVERECNKLPHSREISFHFVDYGQNDDVEVLTLAHRFKCKWHSQDNYAKEFTRPDSGLSQDVRERARENYEEYIVSAKIAYV